MFCFSALFQIIRAAIMMTMLHLAPGAVLLKVSITFQGTQYLENAVTNMTDSLVGKDPFNNP